MQVAEVATGSVAHCLEPVTYQALAVLVVDVEHWSRGAGLA